MVKKGSDKKGSSSGGKNTSGEVTKFHDYDYRANASIVLRAQNRTRSTNDPTGSAEVQSLKENLSHKMGDRVQFSKPSAKVKKVEKKKKKKKATQKFQSSSVVDAVGQNYYQPKTQETEEAYEAMLSFIQSYLGDISHEVLLDATNDILSILKNSSMKDPQRYGDINDILKTLSQDDFSKLTRIGHQITDFSLQNDYSESDQATKTDTVSFVVEGEEGESEGEEVLDEIQESDESDSENEGEETDQTTALQFKKLGNISETTKNDKKIDLNSIDAYWLQRELNVFYKDANISQNMANQILEILEEEDDRECENRLVSVLDYDKFDFITLLMNNRWEISYCTKLKRATNEEQKKEIKNEMKKNPKTKAILRKLTASDKSDVQSRVSDSDSMKDIDDDMDVEEGGFDQELQMIDLESLEFDEGSHFMSNKDCELPEGAKRDQYKGYEEVLIPFIKAPPVKSGELVELESSPKWIHSAFPNVKRFNRMQSKLYKSALSSSENILLCAPTGAGKAQPLHSNVLTLNGWKKMGDISLGDQLITPSGEIADVQGVFPQGKKPIYKIEFEDGRIAESCDEHLWEIFYEGSYQIKTLAEIIQMKSKKEDIRIRLLKPIKGRDRVLPIDPYILGYLISQKSSNKQFSEKTIGSNFVLKKIQDKLSEEFNIKHKHNEKNTGETKQYIQFYKRQLEEMGFFQKNINGFRISETYKLSSLNQKIELLQGIFDTNSECNRNTISYRASSLVLASDIQEVVWSIGGICKMKKYSEEKKEIYELSIKYENLSNLVSVPEKMNNLNENESSLKLGIETVTYVSELEAQCILICHPDHLYITDNYVVTHNTNVAILSMLNVIGQHLNEEKDTLVSKDFKIVYVAPMKALVQEVVGNLKTRLHSFGINISELTGDVNMTRQQLNETQIIVTTPEKWDIVTRKSGDRSYVNMVKLIIIDEIHLLHDDRGHVLESIVARTIRHQETTEEPIRLLGLSATLPNFKDVASFLRVKPENLFYFDNSFRPCPLEQQYIGVSEKKALKRIEMMNTITYDKIIQNVGKHQYLVFVHSRKETAKTGKFLRDRAIDSDEIGKFIAEKSSRVILKSEAENATNEDLKDLLPYGFAIHHAGMTRHDRTLVEDLFADKHIQVLVCTATLAWGVNLPAHTVIIKGTQIYNPEKSRWMELSALDIMQMMGRAGRPGFDESGTGILITTQQELQYYLSLLNQQLPIESQYIKKLADNLNAEIVLGTINNIDDAVNWLGYTYLYVRLLTNPKLYGITKEQYKKDKHLLRRRRELIHTASTILNKHNLIRYDKRSGKYQSTELGRVASHYYVSYKSIATFNEHLKPSMNDIEVFRLFCLSEEFKHMSVRQEEKMELQKLLLRVPIPVKETVEEATAKVNVLLQAYISQFKLDGYALSSDMVYITQSAGRIVRALFEISLERGWAQLSEKLLDLSKMIEKRMWSCQTPLRQFRGLPQDIVSQLERKDIPWDRLHDMEPQDLGSLIRFAKMGNLLYRYVHLFPRLDLTAHIQPITRSVLKIDLTITPDFQWNDKEHGTAQTFWVFVVDVDGEVILHYEQFLLRKKFSMEEHYVSFTAPIFDPLPPQYFIHIISDKFIGSKTSLPISFRHLILPEKYAAPTELLDLQPLPVSGLRNKLYSQLYSSFETFNPIQTQTFNTLYNTDENVFLAAPVGSGKTVCAEFALLRAHGKYGESMKAIYVVPYQTTANNRFKEWSEKFGNPDTLNLSVERFNGNLKNDLKLLERGNIIVCTPEQWDSVSRLWRAKNRRFVRNAHLFLVDQLHLIQGDKGPVMEVVLSRMRFISSNNEEQSIRIVGLSASVANAQDLGKWIGASTKNHSIFNFHPNSRPLPLEINIQGFNQNTFNSRMIAMMKPTYQTIKNTPQDKNTLVYVSSRKNTRFVVNEMISYLASEKNPKMYLNSLKNEDEYRNEIVSRTNIKLLQYSLQFGIGFIYDTMSEDEKSYVEELYENETIKILITTYDLSWELEFLHAYSVVIMGTEYYDGFVHRYTDYSITDILQMMGRACRSLKDKDGKCTIYCSGSKKEYYKKFLYESLPVESHLDQYLADHLNSEIAVKTIESKQDAIDYLTWTFLYRRLIKNPNYYGLRGKTRQHLSERLSELIENALEELQLTQCIAIEEDEISPLNLGMIASHYYIKHTTIEIFSSSLTSKTKLRGILEILCAASEFDEIPVRFKEDEVLRKAAAHVPLPIDNPKYTDPHTKVNILLQSHFSRVKLNYELEEDKKIVLKHAYRLLSAMVDVISSNGWLNPAVTAMELCQMIVQALWIDKDSFLMQIPYFDKNLCKRFEKEQNVETIYDFIEMDDDVRNQILKFDGKKMVNVANALNRYPNIELEYEIEDKDEIETEQPVTLSLDFNIEEDMEHNTPIHCPFYPEDSKYEDWWVIVGDTKTNQLLFIKRMTVNKSCTKKVQFLSPKKEGKYNLKLYLMCDSYAGCDQEYDLSMDVKQSEEVESEDEENVEASDEEMKDE